MAIISASPQPLPTTTPQSSTDEDTEGNGIKVPQTSVPTPNPIDSQSMATLKGDSAIAKAAGSKSSGGGGMGGLFGAIGSAIGKVIPFLSKGGMVGCGYSAGGPTMNPDNTYGGGQSIEPPPTQPTDPGAPNNGMQQAMDHAMGIGYAIGALHQRDYGGTPDTLGKAAETISKLVGGDPGQQSTGFAGGGTTYSTPIQQLPQQQPTTYSTPIQQFPPQQPQQPQQPMPMASGFMQKRRQLQGIPGPSTPLAGLAAGGPPPGGFMPPMPGDDGKPPLQPGQPFVGEGEVKGPGGPTDDAIPAKLSNGEYVMSAPAVAFFGVDKMDKMNMQGKEGFMRSKMQVDANQAPAPGMAPNASPAQGMPPQGQGAMAPPQMPPMQQAQGGAAITRTRNSGFMG